MTALISPEAFTSTVSKLRSFFLNLGFLEVHTQNRLSILAACEDPTTVSTFEYAGNIWPLPQTGQMWLEYELLKNPALSGVFCVSTSYRLEPNPVTGRHDLIFPMFEFEAPVRWLTWKPWNDNYASTLVSVSPLASRDGSMKMPPTFMKSTKLGTRRSSNYAPTTGGCVSLPIFRTAPVHSGT